MRARVDAGTDVAMIGAWDAQRSSSALTSSEQKDLSDTLTADAAQGHLFLLYTGADGGGPVDVYVDEAIPSDVTARLTRLEGEYLVAVPSGALVVGGVEDYRSPAPRITAADSSVAIPAGDYALRCYAPQDPEQTPGSERALRKMVGSADLKYYDRVNSRGCAAGASTLLLFPILTFPLGWKIALAVTIVVFLAFFPMLQWLLKRNARYQRLNAIVPTFRLQNQDPVFVFQLRRVSDRAGLKGGSLYAAQDVRSES